jgi:tetratricopeptide (TPR) repeat protein
VPGEGGRDDLRRLTAHRLIRTGPERRCVRTIGGCSVADVAPLSDNPTGGVFEAGGRVGRPERPLDPTAGLLQAFAHDLRELRRTAGNPKYRALARHAGYSASSLSAAASGWSVPSLPVTLAYVGACGGDAGEWEQRWHELVAKLAAERQSAEPLPGAAPAQRPPATPRQLPMDVPGFVGREAELAELDGLLAAAAKGLSAVVISTVAGTGGVGKTALAVHWAHRVADRFPDGQLYVNLRGYDPHEPVRPADALSAFLRCLGVDGGEIPYELDERAALYRSLVAGRRMLVLLDNARSAGQVRPLLPGTPSCFVVVTSRDNLAGLVARDGARRIDLDLLPLPDAVGLLAALIGGRVEAEPKAAMALAARCARLPLALRIAAEQAAARTDASLTELAEDLADQGRRLDLLDVGDDEHSTVRAVFSWSYRNLAEPAAAVFRLLGLHPGREVDDHAVAALAGPGLTDPRRLLDVLVNAHLVQQVAPGRFGMHDLLRAYAGERAAELPDGERRAALTRLFDLYLSVAAAAVDLLSPHDRHRRPRVAPPGPLAPALPDADAARAWLDTERANLLAVAAHAARDGWPAHATRLAATLAPYLDAGAHTGEALALHRAALDAARTADDPHAEATAWHNLGIVYGRWGRHDEAVDHFERALAIRRESDDRTAQAFTLNNLSAVNTSRGRFAEALRQQGEALAIRRAIGDRAGEGVSLGNIGGVYWRLHRFAESYAHSLQALAIHREVGHRLGVAFSLIGLGAINSAWGRYGEAMTQHEEALRILVETGYSGGEAYVLDEMGNTYRRMGRHDEAVDHHLRALEIHRRIGYRLGEAETLDNLGSAYLAAGRPDEAVDQHRQAVAIARAIDNQFAEAHALNGLGEALRLLHHRVDALAAHRSALTLARTLGDRYREARSLDHLAAVLADSGEPDEARLHWREALCRYGDLDAGRTAEVRARLAGS